MANFESRAILKSSHEDGPRRLSETTLSNLEILVKEEVEQIDPEDVAESIGISDEEVKKDQEYLRTTKDKINRSNELAKAIKEKRLELSGSENKEILNYYERLGHVFEGFLYTHIGESKIFKDVILHKTAEYDDVKNGVDFVAEYKNPNDPSSYVALAMDASFSMSPTLIGKKMDRSLLDIKHQHLSEVKYFQFDESASEAKLGIPRVVVGTDEDRVRALLQSWDLNASSAKQITSFEENPVWTIMALQIVEQLKMFIQEAESHGQTQLASVCGVYLKALELSIRLNKDLVDKHQSLILKDGTSIAIKSFCERSELDRRASKRLAAESAQARKDDAEFNRAVGR